MATESPTRSDWPCSPCTAMVRGTGQPTLERKRRRVTLALALILAGAIGLAFPEWPFVPVVLVAAGIALLGAAALGRGARPS